MKWTLLTALALCVAAALAGPAVAEVALPDGEGNTVGTSCADGETTLVSGEESWPLVEGKLTAVASADDQEWGLMCKMSNGFSKVSTKCYDPGHVVAGRAGEALKVGCYDGPVPAALK